MTLDKLTAHMGSTVRSTNPKMWGIFFEDINYGADGGLNADLVQNGAFEYNYADHTQWTNYSFWNKEYAPGTYAAFSISTDNPVAEENPHHPVVDVEGGPAWLTNDGFDGMTFTVGERYTFSMWAKVEGAHDLPVNVQLLDQRGQIIGSAQVRATASRWNKVTATLEACADETLGALRIEFPQSGIYAVDFVSLEPTRLYKGLEHFRYDLVQVLDELHPSFMRFPGGCIVHGNGIDNVYHWKNSVGAVEHRKHNFNIWGYHQSFRIGFYEYFRLCETIGAAPLPVLPAGVTCQGTQKGPVAFPQSEMGQYVQDVLDLIEFANGDVSTPWGKVRADMGHPAPFGMTMLGIGNEDQIDEAFKRRFEQIYHAVTEAHPEITVVGTSGGWEYMDGRAYGNALGVPILDEHPYRSPAWWFRHTDFYGETNVPRGGSTIYVGEYGSNENFALNGLAEACAMQYMEYNGDAVSMASYAPLFARNGHHKWVPDLIFFDGQRAYHTYSYWVQRMFMHTPADSVREVLLDGSQHIERHIDDTINFAIDSPVDTVNDFIGITVTLPDGRVVNVPDMHVDGAEYADAGLDLHGGDYTVNMHVRHVLGRRPVALRLGAGKGHNHYWIHMDRWWRVLSWDASSGEYETARIPFDNHRGPYRPGDEYDLRVEVKDCGRHIRVFVNGELTLDGKDYGPDGIGNPVENRRFVTMACNAKCGETYIRVVNATADAMQVDLHDVLSGFDDLDAVQVVTLAASDPRDGGFDVEAPTSPQNATVDLSAGSYVADPWSFSILTIR